MKRSLIQCFALGLFILSACESKNSANSLQDPNSTIPILQSSDSTIENPDTLPPSSDFLPEDNPSTSPTTPPIPAVTLNLEEDAGISRSAEPTAQGIPLAPGMKDPALIAVKDSEGKALPTQVHSLGLRHPDGSLKWILLQFQANANASEKSTYQLVYGNRPPLPEKNILINEKENGVEVVTGPMKFILPKRPLNPRDDKKFLPSQIWINDSGQFTDQDLVLNQAPQFNLTGDWEHMTVEQYRASGKNAADLDSFGVGNRSGIWADRIIPNMNYSGIFSCPCKIDIEERGPLRAVFRISPEQAPREGDLSYVARIYAYAGKKYIKVELNLENHDSYFPVGTHGDGSGRQYAAIINAKHIRNFQIIFTPNLDRASSTSTYGLAEGNTVSSGGNSKFDQLGIKHAALNGRSLGSKAEGWMQTQSAGKSFLLAMAYFWEIYPKAFESIEGEIVMHLWPSSTHKATPISSGRQRNYDFLMSFDPHLSAQAQSAMMRNNLRAFPAPEYVAQSGVAHPTISWEQSKKFKTFRQNSQARFRNKQLLYGDVSFGDQPSWNQGHLIAPDERPEFTGVTWNGFHGVSHEFFQDYFASGDPKNYRLAEAVARHLLHIDTHHNGIDAGARNMIGGRTYDHMANWAMGGMYQWIWGDVDYYLLSGKRNVYESLVRNADYLMGFSAYGLGGFVPSRPTTIPFMSMAYLYQAIGSEKALKELYPLGPYANGNDLSRNDVLSLDKSKHILSVMQAVSEFTGNSFKIWPYEEGRSYKDVSFFIPYASEACFAFWEITKSPQARECVIGAADYLNEHLSLPSGMPFYSSSPEQPAGSPWQPSVDEIENVGALAYRASGDKKYLQYSWGPLDWRLNYGEIATGINGFNSAIGTVLWTLFQAGQSEKSISQLRSDIAYDEALTTMMKKARENIHTTYEQGYGNYCGLALEAARVLINSNKKEEALSWLNTWKNSWDHCNSTNNDWLSIDKFIAKAQNL